MNFKFITGTGSSLNAAALHDVATAAALEWRNPEFVWDLRGDLSLVSIVFAAASLEAFVNETAAVGNYLRNPDAGWGMVRVGAPQGEQPDPTVWRKVAGSQPFMHRRGGQGTRRRS